MPICGANRSRPLRMGVPARHVQPYSQVVLKNQADNRRSCIARFASRENTQVGRAVLALEIVKAATLVMLQPSAPARELTAWRHAPSQPLMRSPLSRAQTPAPPRRVRRFFRVWLPFRSPCRADHSAYFGATRFISPVLSAVDAEQTK